jgi:hypothetical protein
MTAVRLLDEALLIAERLEEPQLMCPTRAARKVGELGLSQEVSA